MTHQNETESPQPVAEAESLVGVASTDLLAFSSILGGLLASGHYTEQVEADEDGHNNAGLICDDYGKNWEEYQADDPFIFGRFVPVAIQTAETLLRLAKRNLEANALITETQHKQGDG